MKTYARKDLALYGGPKAKRTLHIPMFPGGLDIGAESLQRTMRALTAA